MTAGRVIKRGTLPPFPDRPELKPGRINASDWLRYRQLKREVMKIYVSVADRVYAASEPVA